MRSKTVGGLYVMCPILDHEMFLCQWSHKMENTENIVNSNTPSCSAINFTLKSTILTILSIFLTLFWKLNVSAKFYFETCVFTFGCCIPPPWQICSANQVQSTRRVKMTFQCQAVVNAMSDKKNTALSHFGPCPILGHPPSPISICSSRRNALDVTREVKEGKGNKILWFFRCSVQMHSLWWIGLSGWTIIIRVDSIKTHLLQIHNSNVWIKSVANATHCRFRYWLVCDALHAACHPNSDTEIQYVHCACRGFEFIHSFIHAVAVRRIIFSSRFGRHTGITVHANFFSIEIEHLYQFPEQIISSDAVAVSITHTHAHSVDSARV